jgi:hypothetical protein
LRLVIIHFQPIEKYPPILNFLNYCSEIDFKWEIIVLTTKLSNIEEYCAKTENIKIYREKVIRNDSNILFKLLSYFTLYATWLYKIIKTKPESILYYETLSSLPVFLYSKIKKNIKVFIHYHEYTTKEEYNKASVIVKFSHKLEKKLFKEAKWISHTNNKRLSLFLHDEDLILDTNKHKILPNYPSIYWAKSNYSENKSIGTPIKFVYFGAIGLETMYLKEIINFIKSDTKKFSLDIYTNQSNGNAIEYIKANKSENISLLGSVNYFDIPAIIKQKDYKIGLILYNGHIKNYIYNAPNKLFEYLACGLNVWFPKVMEGCYEYENYISKPYTMKVDFNNLESSYHHIINLQEKKEVLNKTNYYYEDVYNNLISSLQEK